MADDLTPAEVATLLGIIEGSRRRQAERLIAVEAGVRLAAEQVQDVRLRLLESPPPLDVSSLLIQVGLTLVFETSILGWISGRAATALLAPLARMERGAARAVQRAAARRAAAGRVLPSGQQTEAQRAAVDEIRQAWLRSRPGYPRLSTTSPQFQKALGQGEASLAAANLAAQRASQQSLQRVLLQADREYMRLAAQAERVATTHARLRDVLTREGNLNTGGAIQATAAGWLAGRSAGPGMSPTETALEPGVMIQQQAAAWVAGWRIMNDDRHDVLAQEVRSPGCSRDDAEDMLGAMDPTEDLGAALEQLREATAITVEALIWAQLVAGGLPRSPRFDDLVRFAPATPTQEALRRLKGILPGGGVADDLVKSDLDPRLRDYLSSRFSSVVEAGDAPLPAGSRAAGGEVATAIRQVRVLRWLAALNYRYEDASRQFASILSAR